MAANDEQVPLLNTVNVDAPNSDTARRKFKALLCVLVVIFFERLAYYSITTNLASFSDELFANQTRDGDHVGLTINTMFQGTAFFCPLLAGIIADTFLGKKRLLAWCFPPYILGAFLLTLSGVDTIFQEARKGLFFSGLALCAVGAAGIRACLTPYGADQITTKNAQRSFFHWSYFVINLSSLIATAGISYVEVEYYFWSGFLFAPCSMILSLLAFHIGNRWCRETEIPSYKLFATIKQLFSGARRGTRNALPERNRLVVDPANSRAFASVLIYLATSLGFQVVYSVYQSVYFLQGCQMDGDLGSWEITPTSIMIFDMIIILLVIPVLDRLVWPFFETRRSKISYLYRIGCGTACGILSLFAALLVERYRHLNVQLSIVYQTPQFVLMGIGEVLVFITCYELAYVESPVYTKSTTMGLAWTAGGIAFYISTFILYVEKTHQDWFPVNGDDPQLTYPFMIIECVVVAFFMLYLIVACTRKHGGDFGDSARSSSINDDNESLPNSIA